MCLVLTRLMLTVDYIGDRPRSPHPTSRRNTAWRGTESHSVFPISTLYHSGGPTGFPVVDVRL